MYFVYLHKPYSYILTLLLIPYDFMFAHVLNTELILMIVKGHHFSIG